MKLSPFIFLAVLCIFISPSSALVWEDFTTMGGVGNYEAPSGVTVDRSNFFTFCNGTSVMASDHTLSNSITLIYNMPSTISDVVATKDYVYVILNTGDAYKLEHTLSAKDFNTYILSGENRNGIYLGDFSTVNEASQRIAVDELGNIYISSKTPDQIQKIDKDTYAISTLSSNYQHSANAINPIYCGQSDFLILRQTANGVIEIGSLNRVNSFNSFFSITSTSFTPPSSILAGNSIVELTNGNYIVIAAAESVNYPYIAEYNKTSLVGIISYATQTSTLSSDYISLDAIVLPNGIIVISDNLNDNLITFSTYSGAGGYVATETGLTSPQIEYTKTSIQTEYSTYYNMSSVVVQWNIAIDENWFDTAINSYDPLDRYDFTFELWSPDGVSVSSYKIADSSFRRESYWLGIIGSGDMISIGGATYPNIAMNGTWQVRLYEKNTVQGTKALLDSYSFEIQNVNNPFGVGTGTQPIDSNPTNIVSNFLESPYLIAIIIIGVVGFQFGRGRDGNINGSAMIVLIPLAVGLCALMGILPMWILYVMVLCIIAFVAIKMSSGGS